MIQGTGSHVGKSLIVAGLCRAFTRRGLKVAPFKPQNMSNNAAVTADGGEIGRAQALQARACGIPVSRHMNPVLLKPEGEGTAQLVVQGKREARMGAMAFHAKKPSLMPRILESFAEVSQGRDLVLVEGAGSPAEINLRAGDIANMGFAQAANLPVAIVADIDRGGAIASLIGTQALLDFTERMRVCGIIINKFRGDVKLFEPALDVIAGRTGWRSFGVVPWFDGAGRLPDEDSVSLSSSVIPAKAGIQGPSSWETALDSRLRGSDDLGNGKPIRIVVLKLPRIANSDDLDPLRAEPDVQLDFLAPGNVIPGDADLVIIPGSKATIADLAALRATGWHIDLAAHHRRGGRILGICAGYQMLGQSVADPGGVEGPPETVPGLGLLDVATTMAADKTLRPVEGAALGMVIKGYEMHMGVTSGPDAARPMAVLDAELRHDGAISKDGLVLGCSVHGLFAADGFRRWFLSQFRSRRDSTLQYESMVEETLDALAVHLETHLNLGAMLAAAKGERGELLLEVPKLRG